MLNFDMIDLLPSSYYIMDNTRNRTEKQMKYLISNFILRSVSSEIKSKWWEFTGHSMVFKIERELFIMFEVINNHRKREDF